MNAFMEVWFLGAYDSLRPAPGSTIVDAGANVGLFTLKASRWVGDSGRVVAVEPIPSICNILHRNLRRNRIHNVTVVRKAISDRNGRVNIDGLNVESITLDELQEEVGDGYPDAVKIDVEGYEVKALHGARNMLLHTNRLALETHSNSLEREVKSFLTKTGFQVFDMSPKTLVGNLIQSIFTNPSCFVENEVERTRSWSTTGGPFLLSPVGWMVRRRRPDWMSEQSALKLLTAKKEDSRNWNAVS